MNQVYHCVLDSKNVIPSWHNNDIIACEDITSFTPQNGNFLMNKQELHNYFHLTPSDVYTRSLYFNPTHVSNIKWLLKVSNLPQEIYITERWSWNVQRYYHFHNLHYTEILTKVHLLYWTLITKQLMSLQRRSNIIWCSLFLRG